MDKIEEEKESISEFKRNKDRKSRHTDLNIKKDKKSKKKLKEANDVSPDISME